MPDLPGNAAINRGLGKGVEFTIKLTGSLFADTVVRTGLEYKKGSAQLPWGKKLIQCGPGMGAGIFPGGSHRDRRYLHLHGTIPQVGSAGGGNFFSRAVSGISGFLMLIRSIPD